jgi:hypothetical protein
MLMRRKRSGGFLLLPGGKEYRADQWNRISRKIVHTCCDCRATHKFEFRVRHGELEMRGWPDEALTEARKAGLIL